jgi:2-isopropylmalate synthase
VAGWLTHSCLAPAGSGADEDIVVASARAYVGALNKMIGFISASKPASEASSSRSSDRPAVEGVAVPAASS